VTDAAHHSGRPMPRIALDPAAIPYAISEIDELIARTLSKLDRYTQSDWHHADPPDTNGDI